MNDKKQMISNFLNDFGLKDTFFLDYRLINDFACDTNNLDVKDSSSLFFAGVCLATFEKKKIKPTLELLEMVREKTTSQIKLNKKASWLFICGRDILPDGIEKKDKINNKAIVLNEKDEIIGVAQQLLGRDFIKNYWNIGDFLKREN